MTEQTNELFSRVQQLAAAHQPKQEKTRPALEKSQAPLEQRCSLPGSVHEKELSPFEKLPEAPRLKNALARKDAEWQATVEEYKRILRKCF